MEKSRNPFRRSEKRNRASLVEKAVEKMNVADAGQVSEHVADPAPQRPRPQPAPPPAAPVQTTAMLQDEGDVGVLARLEGVAGAA